MTWMTTNQEYWQADYEYDRDIIGVDVHVVSSNIQVFGGVLKFCYVGEWVSLHGWMFSGLILNSGFWGWLSIESQPQNAELGTL